MSLLSRLVRHPLPGNVRQLRNVARHFVISNRGRNPAAVTPAVERLLGDNAAFSLPPPPLAAPPANPSPSTRPPRLPDASLTDEQLVDALRTHGWSPNRTAASLGIPTGTLHDLMRRSGTVKRAADFSDDELRVAITECSGDTHATADRLCVSERALRIALRQRGLLEND